MSGPNPPPQPAAGFSVLIDPYESMRLQLRQRRLHPPPPPPPPPPPDVEWTLYIREIGAETNIAGMLDIPTICPTSMALLLYTRVAAMLFKFQFQIQQMNNGEPRFSRGTTIYDLERLAQSHHSLEPRSLGEEIRKKKERLAESLEDLKMACIYGCSLLCDPAMTWISKSLDSIKGILGTGDHELLQPLLIARLEAARETLSNELGNHAYFFHDLDRGVTSCSMLDAQHAACTIIIMRFFSIKDGRPQSPYTTQIHYIMKRHIALWAQGDRMLAWFIRERPHRTNLRRILTYCSSAASLQRTGMKNPFHA